MHRVTVPSYLNTCTSIYGGCASRGQDITATLSYFEAHSSENYGEILELPADL